MAQDKHQKEDKKRINGSGEKSDETLGRPQHPPAQPKDYEEIDY